MATSAFTNSAPANTLIVEAVRTPIASLGGSFAELSAPELGAVCIQAALDRVGLAGGDVDQVIMGNVVGAGVGQNPARQASIRAKLPASVPAMTVNKVCGSGLAAVVLGTQSLRLGESQIVVAGGMESMSRAPYLLSKARQGYRLGHGELLDSLIVDGLWDCYGHKHMGTYGDQCAAHCHLSRQDQDDFAVRSYVRAREAIAAGYFQREMVAVPVTAKKQTVLVNADDGPIRFDEAKLRALRPAFSEAGTVTAGNASSINDGAAALILATGEECARRHWKPLARIAGYATHSREPEWFTLAPIDAIRKLLKQLDWSLADTDLFEINEAFSCVALAAERELGIPAEKINIHGGAVSLGHPIGCSGARILVTLVHALERSGGRRGIACLCVGGGEAVAVAVER